MDPAKNQKTWVVAKIKDIGNKFFEWFQQDGLKQKKSKDGTVATVKTVVANICSGSSKNFKGGRCKNQKDGSSKKKR